MISSDHVKSPEEIMPASQTNQQMRSESFRTVGRKRPEPTLRPTRSNSTSSTLIRNPEDEIVLQCHHGGRSMKAANFLKEKGFKNVINLKGGIDEWAEKFDPDMARY